MTVGCRHRVVWVLAFVLVSSLGCAASRPSVTEPPLVIGPENLYPLKEGNAWSYDIDTGDASTTLATKRVETVHGPIVTVRSGDAAVRYEIREEGVFVLADNAWLFRAPLEEGSTWPARGGRTGRIESTVASIETAAGRFHGCLEVIETGGKLGLEVRTVYCPFVGPVAVDSTMRSDVSDRSQSVRARLRGYNVDGESVSP
ncbi:MAG: hypothetical protein AAF500_19725 [Myxococcota bacterium]